MPDGRVLVAGGFDNYNFGRLASAEIYDPSTSRGYAANSMAQGRQRHAAVTLTDGRVLVAGGIVLHKEHLHGFRTIASVEVYDPSTDTWSSADSMADARHNHTAALLPDGKVLVVGGSNGARPLDSAEVYDPLTDAWRKP